MHECMSMFDIALLVAATCISVVSPLCLEQPLPPNEWSNYRFEFLPEFQVRAMDEDKAVMLVSPGSVIDCNGIITQWRILWSQSQATTECTTLRFNFFVFRIVVEDDCGSYNIVGSNQFVTNNRGPDMLIVESVFHVLNPEDLIIVQEGDFISVIVELNSECTEESTVWVIGKTGVQDSVVQSYEFDSILSALFLGSLVPCTLERSESTFAYFTATIDNSSSPQEQPNMNNFSTIPTGALDVSSTHESRFVHTVSSTVHTATSQAVQSSDSLYTTTFFSTHTQSIWRTIHSNRVSSSSSTTAAQMSSIMAYKFSTDGEFREASDQQVILIIVGTLSCSLFLIVTVVSTTVMLKLRYGPKINEVETQEETGNEGISRDTVSHPPATLAIDGDPGSNGGTHCYDNAGLDCDGIGCNTPSSGIGSNTTYSEIHHNLPPTESPTPLNLTINVAYNIIGEVETPSTQHEKPFYMTINGAYGTIPSKFDAL